MVDRSEIREHMKVLGSDGAPVGTVDHVEGDRIKLTRTDSPDGAHHYVALSDVVRVDSHVHLAITGATAGVAAGLGAAGPGAIAGQTAYTADHGTAPFPPVVNRQVEGARPRGNFYLPWIVAIVGLLLLALLFRSCAADREEPAAVVAPAPGAGAAAGAVPALPVEAVQLPNGQSITVEPNSLNYELQRYLASAEAAPRTFTFDKLNFDTASAAIRPVDQANVDALAMILSAYPAAQVRIVGYTDARGGPAANAELGKQRADAVAAALVAKGVAAPRVATTSGGETDPADTNATAPGRFDNRRSELVVTAK